MFSKILEIPIFTAERRVEKSFKFASPFLVTVANERGFGSTIGRFNESEEEGTGNPAKEGGVRAHSFKAVRVRRPCGER